MICLSRYTKVKEIYDFILADIMKEKQSWKDFLIFHATVYKHNFNNAVLIYAQRPDATLVADMNIWNRRIGRWINRGAKSIAVIDESGNYPKLQYLFDIKDTNGPDHTIPTVWQLDSELEQSLINKHEIKKLEELIMQKTLNVVLQYRDEYKKGIERDIEKSSIGERPLEGVINCFDQMVMDSIEYMTFIRCGIVEPVLTNPNPFSVIEDFSSRELTLRLGNTVSSLSERILRDLEKDIKVIKKEQRSDINHDNSSNRLQEGETRQSSIDSAVTGAGTRSETTREVRSDVIDLSERRISGQIQPNADRGNIDGDHAQSESGGMGQDGSSSEAIVEEKSDTQSDGHLSDLQTQRNDQDTSRRNRTEGDHSQVQIETDEESLQVGGSFSVDEMSDDELIDKVILRGSGFTGGKQRIVDYFAEEESGTERSKFLKNEYGTGGASISFSDDLSGFENHDSKGIRIEIYEEDQEIKLSWPKVAKKSRMSLKTEDILKNVIKVMNHQ